MSDEEKKRIVSQPPPPTDEVDGEWGDDDDKTLVRGVAEAVTKAQPAPPAAVVAETAVAPLSVPAKAAEASTPPQMKAAAPVSAADEDDDETDEEEDDDHGADEEEADGEHHEENDADVDDSDHAVAPTAAGSSKDWIPEWAPFAVLALLVSVSILVGLGLVGGSSAPAEETAEKPDSGIAKPAAKPSNHP